jgi:hypothetical protein
MGCLTEESVKKAFEGVGLCGLLTVSDQTDTA